MEKQQLTRRRILWFVAALLALAFDSLLAYSAREQWLVYHKGHLVNVVVKALPRMSRSISVTIGFKGKTYVEDIKGPGYLHVGDSVRMYYLESESSFGDPNNDQTGAGVLLALGMLACAGAFVYYGLRKEPPAFKAFGSSIA